MSTKIAGHVLGAAAVTLALAGSAQAADDQVRLEDVSGALHRAQVDRLECGSPEQPEPGRRVADRHAEQDPHVEVPSA